MSIIIREGNIDEVVALSNQIPEFIAPCPKKKEYENRLLNVNHLILVAFYKGEAAGFKVGYEREDYFYSWMGAILPPFRRKGIASALAIKQEQWVKSQGYELIRFKTRNRLKGMLQFSLSNGFIIEAVTKKDNPMENRILLSKKI